jgi:glutaredoxin
MAALRKVEIFSAGCPVCRETVELINRYGSSSCEVTVHDMHSEEGSARAAALGVATVPAVAVDGELLSCCTGRGVSRDELRRAGVR